MKKLLWLSAVLSACAVFAELPISQTSFRKAPMQALGDYIEARNPEALLEVALRYYAGHQVEKDDKKAFHLMKLSAEQNHPQAIYLLCLMYEEGIGTSADTVKFEECLAAGVVSNPTDQQLLGLYDKHLKAVAGDPDDQVRFLEISLAAGYAPAYILLHSKTAELLYRSGKYEEALPQIQDLAAKGDAVSIYYLAEMYMKGLGGLPKDDVNALSLYLKSAEKGCAEAQYELACIRSDEGTIDGQKEAVAWFEKAARSGNRDSLFRMAEFKLAEAFKLDGSLEGLDEDSADEELTRCYHQTLSVALKYYGAAAEAGHSNAQFVLGRLYASGDAGRQDYEKAIHFYTLASERGHSDALFYLGLMYHAGLGVEKDVSRAISLYEQAAGAGSKGAQCYLGNCYRFGEGVPQSLVVGESYYLKKALADVETSGNEIIEFPANPWVLKAAREYGVILWNKGQAGGDLERARRWVEWAAKYGTFGARDILVQMVKSRLVSDEIRPVLQENRNDPAEDAVASRWDVDVCCICYLEDVDELYEKNFNFRRVIGRVDRPKKRSRDELSDDRAWMMAVECLPPSPGELLANDETLLLGAVFEDKDGDKRYFAYERVDDREIAYQSDAVTITMSIMPPPERIRLLNSFVVYGNFPTESSVLAVWESRLKGVEVDGVEHLLSCGKSLARLETKVQITRGLIENATEPTSSSQEASPGDLIDDL